MSRTQRCKTAHGDSVQCHSTQVGADLREEGGEGRAGGRTRTGAVEVAVAGADGGVDEAADGGGVHPPDA